MSVLWDVLLFTVVKQVTTPKDIATTVNSGNIHLDGLSLKDASWALLV